MVDFFIIDLGIFLSEDEEKFPSSTGYLFALLLYILLELLLDLIKI